MLPLPCVRTKFPLMLVTLFLLGATSFATSNLQFVATAPCRVADTRNPTGPFGGPAINGGTSRSFPIPQSLCNIPAKAAAYSLNVTVVPHGPLGFLTVWPSGQAQPFVSILNSFDGRTKANAGIVVAGTSGGVSVYASDTTDVILDINGYFTPPGSNALEFYTVQPCRVLDTRDGNGPLGGPSLVGNQARSFPVLLSSCNIAANAQAYSLNVTAVPHGPLYFLSVWPDQQPWPGVSTLNAPATGTAVANAAIVPAGPDGGIQALASNDTDMVVDISGYFAPPAEGGLYLAPTTPCRVLDTRNAEGAFEGELAIAVVESTCSIPMDAQAFVMNATVVPSGALGYLTLWPDLDTQPFVSTLNSYDGAVASNMAIVPTMNGSIDSFASNPTPLILDISSYFVPYPGLTIITNVLPPAVPNTQYLGVLMADGGTPPYSWSLIGGSLPPGLHLASNGVISGTTGGFVGSMSPTVRVQDSTLPMNDVATATVTVAVNSNQIFSVLPAQLPSGLLNTPYAAPALSTLGGAGQTAWSIIAGGLPTGVQLNATTGVVSGTPTATGIYSFTVKANNVDGTAFGEFSLTVTRNTAISITKLSSTTPMALTPIYISTAGLNLSQPISLTFVAADGNAVTEPPIRVQSDGTVVAAVPLYMNPATGQTGSIETALILTQNFVNSAPMTIQVQDIPTNNDYGTSMGQISRAFYNYQELSFGLVQNGIQAIQNTPGTSVDLSSVSRHVSGQLQNEIQGRNDVDRIILNPSLQIAKGTLADGTSMSFNSHSVEMMDRALGVYLTALGPIITSAPQGHRVGGVHHRIHKKHHPFEQGWPGNGPQFGAPYPPGVMGTILSKIGPIGNIATIAAAIRTDWKGDSSIGDRILASEAGAYAAMGLYGLALGTAGAPIVAAAATAGLVIGAFQIANDAYNLYNDPSSVISNANAGSDPSALAAAQSALGSRQGTLILDSMGLALAGITYKDGAGITSLGGQVADWLQNESHQLGLQAGALVDTTLQIYGSFAEADHESTNNAANQFQSPYSSPDQGFGTVDGNMMISNNQGPILSGLTGVLIQDPSTLTNFSGMADESGDYSVVVSLGNSTLNYSGMTLNAYDPVSSFNNGYYDILSSLGVDLSGLLSNSPFNAPQMIGNCDDTDANHPDSDDPDCD